MIIKIRILTFVALTTFFSWYCRWWWASAQVTPDPWCQVHNISGVSVVCSQVRVPHVNTDATLLEAASVLARLLLQAQAAVLFSLRCFTPSIVIRVVVPHVVFGLNCRPRGNSDIDALTLALPGLFTAIIHTFATRNFRLFATPTGVYQWCWYCNCKFIVLSDQIQLQ